MAKSYLVIGMGRFGRHLALKFAQQGDEVMAVDRHEEAVAALADQLTAVQIGDCTDEAVLDSLGVNNFDVCFVCTSSDFQSSLEVTSLLHEKGARYVVSKADRDIHAKFLLRNGADEVVYPERDMARRTAMRFSSNAFEYFALSDQYAVLEVKTPAAWVGKSVGALAVRTRYRLNIIAVRTPDGRVDAMLDANHVFNESEHLILAGAHDDCARLFKR